VLGIQINLYRIKSRCKDVLQLYNFSEKHAV
jgi:hypothetical protein